LSLAGGRPSEPCGGHEAGTVLVAGSARIPCHCAAGLAALPNMCAVIGAAAASGGAHIYHFLSALFRHRSAALPGRRGTLSGIAEVPGHPSIPGVCASASLSSIATGKRLPLEHGLGGLAGDPGIGMTMDESPVVLLVAIDRRHPDRELPDVGAAGNIGPGPFEFDRVGQLGAGGPCDRLESGGFPVPVVGAGTLELLDHLVPPACEAAERVPEGDVLAASRAP
jgi:hypothetical protein